jgi:hypothetical protein
MSNESGIVTRSDVALQLTLAKIKDVEYNAHDDVDARNIDLGEQIARVYNTIYKNLAEELRY